MGLWGERELVTKGRIYQMGRKTPGFSRGDISPLAREGQHVPPGAGQCIAKMRLRQASAL